MPQPDTILLTGASGYVGGRLLTALRSKGLPVRCLARRPEILRARWPEIEVAAGDVHDPDSLGPALCGIATAYYLIHSMGATGSFEEQDRVGASNFAAAAKAAGVRRIVYVGGLADPGTPLSAHLRSRHEVGEVLRASGVDVIELRASIIIGSGSLSFELIRALVERLPVMITPRWVNVPAQPIAIEDVINYLLAALDLPPGSRIFEIGGGDVASYAQVMQEYARQRGLRRWMIPVPFLTPYLSSLWLGLVTPIFARIGRKLIESIRNSSVVRDPSALEAFVIRPMGISAAISRALHNEDQEFAQTRWSDALSSAGPTPAWGGVTFGTRLVDSRIREVACAPEVAFVPIRRIGGRTGWYYANFAWQLRGFLDLLVGGVGLRRGRVHPDELRVGDPIDFWRVESFEPGRRLRLSAEMRLPGRAWLEFEVTGDGAHSSLRQTAIFDPLGLWGRLYWYSIYPLHGLIFNGMLRNIARAALRIEKDEKK